MLLLWILLAIVLVLALLCMTRVGVWAAFSGNNLRLDAKIGLLRVHILPAKPKKSKAERVKRGKKRSRKEPPEKQEKSKPSFNREDVRDALRTMLPPLKRALRRTRKGVRFHPLRLSLVLGGQEDPAAAAQLCGGLQAAVWTGMPVLETLADIPAPYVHMDVDFAAAAPVIELEAGVTFRIGTLIAIGFGLAFPALRWFLRFRKRAMDRSPALEEEKDPSAPQKEPAA